MPIPGIAPYQDPGYGEKPSYETLEQRTQAQRLREQKLAEEQDQIMTDAYEPQPVTENGEQDDGLNVLTGME